MSEAEPVPAREPDVREQMRQQMLDGFGGWTGMLIAAVPTVVFVAVNAAASLRSAVVAAVVSAALLAAYRLLRRQPVQQALNGLVGVLVAAVIAARTGQARGYFLVGIWSSFAYGGVFLASLLVRRPLVGVVWEFLDPTPTPTPTPPTAAGATPPTDPSADSPRPPDEPARAAPPWYHRPALARAYAVATAAATVVFIARGVVQLTLFQQNSTGWLAVARIAMGYPLTIAAVAFAFLMVRRARGALAASG